MNAIFGFVPKLGYAPGKEPAVIDMYFRPHSPPVT